MRQYHHNVQSVLWFFDALTLIYSYKNDVQHIKDRTDIRMIEVEDDNTAKLNTMYGRLKMV